MSLNANRAAICSRLFAAAYDACAIVEYNKGTPRNYHWEIERSFVARFLLGISKEERKIALRDFFGFRRYYAAKS